MATPEDGTNWDDLLKDVDLTGIGDPNRLINRIVVKGDATPEQNIVYDLVRGVLQPHEDYYHAQVVDFTSARGLPRGVKRDWRGRFRFMITTSSGIQVPVGLGPQNRAGRWLARFVQVDNNKINFDRDGKITQIHLGPQAHLPRTILLKRVFYQVPNNPEHDGDSLRLFMRSPTNMGIYHDYDGDYKIQKDGLLEVPKARPLAKYTDRRNLFVNLCRLGIEATDPLKN